MPSTITKDVREMTPEEFRDYMVRNGQSSKMAELLAARQPPGGGLTDSVFLQGRLGGRDLGDPDTASQYRAAARAAGVCTDGMVYSSQLASHPGDPTAWVDSVADVKRVAQKKNLILEGGIKYEPPGVGDQPVLDGSEPYRVANEIVEDDIRAACVDNPELAAEWSTSPQKLEDAREKVRAVCEGDLNST